MLRREVSLRTVPRPGLDTDPTVKESHWSHVAALDSEQTRACTGEVSLDSVVTAVSDSCLLPILEELLRNESLLDMERNSGSYCICFQVHCQQPAASPPTCLLSNESALLVSVSADGSFSSCLLSVKR